MNSDLVSAPPDNVDDLLHLYNSVLSDLLDRHAPEKENVVPYRPSSPWMNNDIIKDEQARSRAVKGKRKSGLVVHIEA